MENQPTVTKNWMIGAIYATYYNKELLVAVVFLCSAGGIGEQGFNTCPLWGRSKREFVVGALGCQVEAPFLHHFYKIWTFPNIFKDCP